MIDMEQQTKKILVVDDDPDILDALQFMLEDAGYEVTTTEKGEYAENLHDTNGGLPDVIILDVLLSGKDGRLICQKLKSQAETRHIPIIMMSAHNNAGQSIAIIGADDFVAKPFDMDELLAKIAKATRGDV
jgi:DNA-binding response OmpR family regulator